MAQKMLFWGLWKCPPSWSFHNERALSNKTFGDSSSQSVAMSSSSFDYLDQWTTGSWSKILQFLWETWMVPERNSAILNIPKVVVMLGGSLWSYLRSIFLCSSLPFFVYVLQFACTLQYEPIQTNFFTVSLKVKYCKLRLVRLMLSWWCCNGEEWLNQTIKLFIAKH